MESPMGLADRVKKILLTPKTEWQVIDGEVITTADLYKGYIIPLAAIGPIASAIGSSVFGLPVPFVGTIRQPIGQAITGAVVSYVLMLVGIFVLGLIIDALAPTFGGTRSQIQGLKVAAYSATASWLAGIFGLIPALALLGLLGLYSFYLLYLGLPVLMKSPPEKALGYTAVVVIVAFVLFMLIGVVTARFNVSPGATGFGT
ncbi:MAG: Yip1 family protein [Gammaproteobacteria bacterium]